MNGDTLHQPRHALDPDWYTRADIFTREQDAIFRSSWRLVGHANMLTEPGDYLTDDLGKARIILVRGDDGVIRGFHNVCRHRAGPLVTDGEGSCGRELICKYHGWRYALDGRLKNARDFGSRDSFDARDYGLYPVATDQWHGFLFASLETPEHSAGDDMAALAKGWSPDSVPPFALRRSHRIACNWKTYVENYLEGYHVPDVHPGLDRDVDSSRYEVRMDGNTAVHFAPPRDENAVYTGYWAWVWPWLGVNVYAHGVMMERMTPVSVNETRLDYLYFFNADRREELDAMLILSDNVTGEDKMICEAVSHNLQGGTYRGGPLSPRHEIAVGYFQDRLRNLVGPA